MLSYIAINVSNTYLDLTGPILWAVALFAIAKIYALATDRALQRWLAFGVKSDAAEHSVLMMPILIESQEALSDALLKKLKRELELSSKTPNSIEIMQGTQSGIWGLFGDMVVVSWLFAANQAEYAASAKQDAQTLAKQLPLIITKLGLPNSTVTRYALHEGILANQPDISMASQWRRLFAQAVLVLESGEQK